MFSLNKLTEINWPKSRQIFNNDEPDTFLLNFSGIRRFFYSHAELDAESGKFFEFRVAEFIKILNSVFRETQDSANTPKCGIRANYGWINADKRICVQNNTREHGLFENGINGLNTRF